jgi:hypothetical protein
VLQNGKRMVQEGALTALASVADSAQVSFGESIFIRLAPRLFVGCVRSSTGIFDSDLLDISDN